MVALTQPKPISLLEWPPEPLDAVACRLSGQAGPLGRLDYEERTISVRAFFFVVADEIDPFAGKVVRKVAFPERLRGNPELLRRILQPEKFGFFPRDPVSLVSIGEHVGLENTSSRFISASERPFGSANYPGKRYWIDLDKLEGSGGVIHEADAIAHDLDRIIARTTDPTLLKQLQTLRHKSLVQDLEVLIEGPVPAKAVKGAAAMGLTRGLQFVQGVGIVLSAYDLGRASVDSMQVGSIRPLAAETVRQAGGWASAVTGMKLGAAAGGFFGIETGPGAVLTAGAGAMVFGVAGYFGWDWVADLIYENN